MDVIVQNCTTEIQTTEGTWRMTPHVGGRSLSLNRRPLTRSMPRSWQINWYHSGALQQSWVFSKYVSVQLLTINSKWPRSKLAVSWNVSLEANLAWHVMRQSCNFEMETDFLSSLWCWWTSWKRVTLLHGPTTQISCDSSMEKRFSFEAHEESSFLRAALQPTSPLLQWLPSSYVDLKSSHTLFTWFDPSKDDLLLQMKT